MVTEEGFDGFENTAGASFCVTTRLYANFRASGGQFPMRTHPQKCIAPNFLAALHRFQEKGFGLVGGNREEGGNGREHVRAYDFGHRNQGVVAGQAGEFLEVGR